MPRSKAHPSQLGQVVNIHGKFCARFRPRDFGQARDFTGPSHEHEKTAIDDLFAIRAAGAEHPTRMGALEAMRQEAKRLKEQSMLDRGGLHFYGDEVRARIQYCEEGVRHDIYGPSRIEERRARADLDAITAAGENQPTRAEHSVAMQAEALDTLTVCYIICSDVSSV